MFDISWGELILIGMVALIVIGPKELPTVLRTIGQWMTKIRRMASEFQGQFQEAMREAEFADLKKQVDAIGEGTNFNPVDAAKREFETALDDKPKSGEPATPPVAEIPTAHTATADTTAAPPAAADVPPIPAAADPYIAPVEPAPAPSQSDFNPDRPADPAAQAAPPQAGGGRAA